MPNEASHRKNLSQQYLERRRGSMIETLSSANKELRETTSQKEVLVRTPRRGRRKSIVILDSNDQPRNFPIGRLNNYNKTLKKHKGPLSLMSELESIDEIDDYSGEKKENQEDEEEEHDQREASLKNNDLKVKK